MTYQIEGPFPLTLRANGLGVDIDVSRFLSAVFLGLFEEAAKDPEGFGEWFADLHALAQSAQVQGRDSHARHEFDESMDKLVDAYADGGTVPLYTTGLRQLRDALADIAAPRPLPGQQDRRAS